MRSYFIIAVGCLLAEIAAHAFDNGEESIVKDIDGPFDHEYSKTSDSRARQGDIENHSSHEGHQLFTPNDDNSEDDSDDALATQSSVPGMFSAPESKLSSIGFFTNPENEDFDDGFAGYYNSSYPHTAFWNDSIYRMARSINGGFERGGPKHDNSPREKYPLLLRGRKLEGIVMKQHKITRHRHPTTQHRGRQRNKHVKEAKPQNSSGAIKDGSEVRGRVRGKDRGEGKDHSRELDTSRFNSSLWSEFKEIEMARLLIKNFFTRLQDFIAGPNFQLEAFVVDVDDMEEHLGFITKWVNDLGQQQQLLRQVRFLHFMVQDMRACAEKLTIYVKYTMEGYMYVTRIISLRVLLFKMYNIEGKLDTMNNWFAGKLFGYWVSVQVWRNNLELLEDTPEFLWNEFETERLTIESRFTTLGRQFPNFDYQVF